MSNLKIWRTNSKTIEEIRKSKLPMKEKRDKMKTGGAARRMHWLSKKRIRAARMLWRRSWSLRKWRWGLNTSRNCLTSCSRYRRSRGSMRKLSGIKKIWLVNTSKMKRSWSINCRTWGANGTRRSRAEATWSRNSMRPRKKRRSSSSHRALWQHISTSWRTRPCPTWSSNSSQASSRTSSYEKKCRCWSKPWTSKYKQSRKNTNTSSASKATNTTT